MEGACLGCKPKRCLSVVVVCCSVETKLTSQLFLTQFLDLVAFTK